jgi:creatinine amidohydrolase/Fe(II)-dependent formamide hydrolase-like protein
MQAIESLGWQRSAHAGGGMRRDYRDIHDLAVRNTSPPQTLDAHPGLHDRQRVVHAGHTQTSIGLHVGAWLVRAML